MTEITAPAAFVAPAVGGVAVESRRTAIQPKLALMAADLVVVALAISTTCVAVSAGWVSGSSKRFAEYAFASMPIWIGIFSRQRLYNTRFIGRRIDEIRRIVNAVALSTLSVALFAYAFGELVARSALVLLLVISVLLVAIEREVPRQLFASLRERGYLVRHVV